MAKQKGLHKLAGKVDEQSYYYSKNGGYQSRKINPGIGERVKTAPEYQNTRLNNAEFGAAGACAGAMIREVSKRWRYILDSIATGKMVKELKALMEQDTTSPWGQRVIQLADMSAVQEKYNQFSKNEMFEEVVDFVQNLLTYNSTTKTLASSDPLSVDQSLLDRLQSIGATGLRITLNVLTVSAPNFIAAAHKYAPSVATIYNVSTNEYPNLQLGEDIITDFSTTVPSVPQNSALAFGGVLVIVEPLRKVGSTNATLQEHCSAYWTAVESAS